MDWSEIIAAVIISLPSMMTLIMAAITQRKLRIDNEIAVRERGKIHDLVNGQSEKLNAMYEARGERIGAARERAVPTV